MANRTETIPSERWKQAADNLKQIVPAVASFIEKNSKEGEGKENADDFAADMFLALTALEYVAKYAVDDCKFILTE